MKNNITELCDFFYKYGSDKCPKIYHSYSPIYYELLKEFKYTFNSVLEIGVGNYELMEKVSGEKYCIGSSLKAWRDFFPNANIYGLDINTKDFFIDDRIYLYYTDQSKAEELERSMLNISKNHDTKFDLILDDGSHKVEDMLTSFKTLFKYIRQNGFYIIEDIKKDEMNVFMKMDLHGGKFIKIFEGNFDWDGFVIIQKPVY